MHALARRDRPLHETVALRCTRLDRRATSALRWTRIGRRDCCRFRCDCCRFRRDCCGSHRFALVLYGHFDPSLHCGIGITLFCLLDVSQIHQVQLFVVVSKMAPFDIAMQISFAICFYEGKLLECLLDFTFKSIRSTLCPDRREARHDKVCLSGCDKTNAAFGQ
jgi:hypothetical protein